MYQRAAGPESPEAPPGSTKLTFSLAAFLIGAFASLLLGLAVGGFGAFQLARRTATTTSDGFSALQSEEGAMD